MNRAHSILRVPPDAWPGGAEPGLDRRLRDLRRGGPASILRRHKAARRGRNVMAVQVITLLLLWLLQARFGT
jgi:hypothetical protein